MSGTNKSNRPLSPHLSIYRPQITSVLSILHRLTGIGLAVPAVLFVWYFLAAATSESHFQLANAILTSWPGAAILIVSLWALWYHFCNGIRHLVWDAGHGFEMQTVTRSGIAVIAASLTLTIVTLVIAWSN